MLSLPLELHQGINTNDKEKHICRLHMQTVPWKKYKVLETLLEKAEARL